MKILLDTHVFLWFVANDRRLPTAYRSAIQDLNNQVVLSIASVWEAAIKYQTGKLPLPGNPGVYLPKLRVTHDIENLPIEEGALTILATLPSLHRDPFDRLLIAQAIHGNYLLASLDPQIAAYSVSLLPG
ncbi:type II toxin-antitoxin system VapC family toxin [Anatilimnocola sp. NA78]|uniref:type II toxin-antitoxin system VapC family toxin n=1 Tax=Anatilimnocola sp. NA78 TaxID=3415683 RepID=UPI003CE48E15